MSRAVKRGDVITVAVSGDCGQPRPAVVIQSDALSESDGVLVAMFTSALRDAALYRLTIDPSENNGLKTPSQIMVDKMAASPRGICGPVIGRLSPEEMLVLNNMLSVMIGLTD